jgi:hypothetical protein
LALLFELTSKFFGGGSGGDSDSNSSSDSEGPRQKISDLRYKEDFEEIKYPGKTYVVLVFHRLLVLRIFLFIFLYIGHGTYGTVMKCKHKLDHMEYAVKRIKVGYHDREVILRY